MTAVEWLYKNLLENPISNQDVEYNEAVFHNAKEMENQQQGYSEEEVIAFGEFIFKHSLLTHIRGVKSLFEQFIKQLKKK